MSEWSASAFLNAQKCHLNMTWQTKGNLGLALIAVK